MRRANFVFALKQLHFEVELIPWTFGSCSKSLPTFLWTLVKGVAVLSLCWYFYLAALKPPNVSWEALQNCSRLSPLHEALLPGSLQIAVPQILWGLQMQNKVLAVPPSMGSLLGVPTPLWHPCQGQLWALALLERKNSPGKSLSASVF